uniref:THAP domain-containing protein 1 n=1 Tax=Lygus hesperus TaxID=30085 RepID=A0A0A9W4R2_LYGHE
MVYCVAFGCKNFRRKHRQKNETEKKVSFFKFPRDPVMNELWVQLLRRPNWRPTANSRLCSEHFAKDQISHYPSGLYLKNGAVPSIFPFHKVRPTKSRRRKKEIIEDSSPDTTNPETDGFLVVEVIQLGNAEVGNLPRNEATRIENTKRENPLLAKMRAALAKAQEQSSHESFSSSNVKIEEEESTEMELEEPPKTVDHSAEEPVSDAEVESDSSSDVEITRYKEADYAISIDEAETSSQDAESITQEDESITHEDESINHETESNKHVQAEFYYSESEPEIISHGEAETMLSQCIEWFEQQPEADSTQISLLRKIRDMAAKKARGERESEQI